MHVSFSPLSIELMVLAPLVADPLFEGRVRLSDRAEPVAGRAGAAV